MKDHLRFLGMLMIASLVYFPAISAATRQDEAGGSAPQKIPLKFSDYDFSQFIFSAGYAPQNVIEMDNNGAIILARLGGRTRDQLRAAGISFTESQIVLMKTWKVLEEKDALLGRRNLGVLP